MAFSCCDTRVSSLGSEDVLVKEPGFVRKLCSPGIETCLRRVPALLGGSTVSAGGVERDTARTTAVVTKKRAAEISQTDGCHELYKGANTDGPKTLAQLPKDWFNPNARPTDSGGARRPMSTGMEGSTSCIPKHIMITPIKNGKGPSELGIVPIPIKPMEARAPPQNRVPLKPSSREMGPYNNMDTKKTTAPAAVAQLLKNWVACFSSPSKYLFFKYMLAKASNTTMIGAKAVQAMNNIQILHGNLDELGWVPAS